MRQFERVGRDKSLNSWKTEVSRETADRLQIYADLLVQWQKTINLVAPSTLGDIWHRHMADSAQLVALAPSLSISGPITWVDIGSGAGFPGLVVAVLLAGRADTRVALVESDVRKCAFLGEVVRKTGISGALAVEILNARIENPSTQARLGRVDVISARALAPLDKLFELSAPLFQPETVAFFMKGRGAVAEIEAAEQQWRFRYDLHRSRTDSEGKIVEVRDLEAKTR